MKQKFLALIILILFFSNNHVNAQFRHFPHGHEFLMEHKIQFCKVKFDTTVFESSHVNAKMYTLWDYNTTPCVDFMKDNSHGCFEDRFYMDSLNMGYIGIGNVYFEISRHIKLGNVFPTNNSVLEFDSLIYLKDTFYSFNNLQDSAAVLYPIENGEINYSYNPVLLGHTLGWLDMSFLVQPGEKFKQYSQLTNGIPVFYPTIDWTTYFPERAGDYKIWLSSYSRPDFPDLKDSVIMHLDSFLSVLVYPDSLVRVILQRKIKSDYTLLPVDTLYSTISKNHPLAKYFDRSNIGSHYHLSDFSNGYADVGVYFWMIHEPMQKLFIGEKNYQISQTPCVLKNDSLSVSTVEEYYAGLGLGSQLYIYKPGDGFILKSNIAYKIGQKTRGNYSLLGVNSATKTNLQLFPNPTSSVLNIDALYNGSQYEIIDLAGATLLSGTLSENSIAVDGLADGTYFLRVLKDDGSVVSGKFVKVGN